MAVDGKRLMSDMRLWMMVSGAIAIVAVNGVLAAVLTGAVADSILKGEAQIMQEFLNSAVAAEGGAPKLFALPAPSPELISFAGHVRSLPGTVRANVYSPDLFIRYSTDANLVGVQFGDNPELVESFGGEVVAELETVSSDSKAEHLALNQLGGEKLIESYVPVKDGGAQVVAVVEFYRKATAVAAIVDGVERRVWIAAAVNAAILVLGMAAAIGLGRRRG